MKLARHLVASLLIGGGMLCGLAGAAMAQDTGSLVRPEPAQLGEKAGEVAARKTMAAYAICLLKRNRGGVMFYLGTFPASAEANKRAARLSVSDCIDSGSLQFSESAFRGAAYQALYRQEFAFKSVDSVADRASPDYMAGSDGTQEKDQQAIGLRQFSDCVVRASPLTVHALAVSLVGSGQENSAFGTLAPNLSACLPKGQTLAFSRNILRNALVEVLYRLRVSDPLSKQGQK